MQFLTPRRIVALVFFTLLLVAVAPRPKASNVATHIVLSDHIDEGCQISKGSAISPLEVRINCEPQSKPLQVEVVPPGEKSKVSGVAGHDTAHTVLIGF